MYGQGPMDFPLFEAEQAIRAEYLNLKPENNPTKIELGLNLEEVPAMMFGNVAVKLSTSIEPHKNSVAFINAMVSRLNNGYYGSKVIMCDMKRKLTSSKTLLFDPDNTLIGEFDSANMTAMRCAVMTKITIDTFLCGIEKPRIGLIGYGRINTYVAFALHRAYPDASFVLKSSDSAGMMRSTTRPVPAHFEHARTWEDMRECDVLISATTETRQHAQLHLRDFGNQAPGLFIAHDGGAIFSESFRGVCENFADDPDSLARHARDNFPFDERPHHFSKIPIKTPQAYRGPTFVSLYGMGFTDMIMACLYQGVKL